MGTAGIYLITVNRSDLEARRAAEREAHHGN
jgi:hypothetical protein